MSEGTWRSVVDVDRDTVHVMREEDADQHVLTSDCFCDPQLQLREHEDGSVGSTFVHLGGKEKFSR